MVGGVGRHRRERGWVKGESEKGKGGELAEGREEERGGKG
jgi:hypothetical protein